MPAEQLREENLGMLILNSDTQTAFTPFYVLDPKPLIRPQPPLGVDYRPIRPRQVGPPFQLDVRTTELLLRGDRALARGRRLRQADLVVRDEGPAGAAGGEARGEEVAEGGKGEGLPRAVAEEGCEDGHTAADDAGAHFGRAGGRVRGVANGIFDRLGWGELA